jgi:hypothetical protein
VRSAGAALVLLGALAALATGPVVTGAEAKSKRCRSTQVQVSIRGHVQCRKLGKAAAKADPRLTFLRQAIGRDLGTIRTRSGRRIKPFWSGRARPVRARLLRALPKALAWAQSRRGRTRAYVPGDVTPCSVIPSGSDSASIDGFHISMSKTGDVKIDVTLKDGYAIAVLIGATATCSNLDLPACPTADGALDGTDQHKTALGMRITKNGELVQSYSSTTRSRQTLKAKVAEDAKLDALALEDVTNETMSFAVPEGSISLRLAVLRTTTVDMRTGTPKPGTTKVRVGVSSSGMTETQAVADATKASAAYEKSFPDLIKEETENARRREGLWQIPGKCAKLTFDPASDTLAPLAEDAGGSVRGAVEANAGGTAAKGKWTLTAQANGVFTPPAAEGGTATFTYLVTNAGNGVKLSASFKATSTAGVAEGTWTQRTKPAGIDAYYVVDAISYSASHTSSSSQSQNTICNVTGSVTESLAINTPLPFEPDFNKLEGSGGAYAGSITQGSSPLNATRSGTVHGCDITMGSPPPACDTAVNLAVPVALGIIVDVPAGSSTAKVSWVLPSVFVGDNGPASPCYTPTLAAIPNPETRTVPAADILAPGQHTLMVTRSVSFSGAFGSVDGNTGASITFHRVNADGSSYTG